jgi:DNA-directed RNA polymerase subunit RPC12/RpoP
LDVVGVSRAKTSGSFVTKSGRRAYRGQRKHWYVYYYDDNGKFRKKMISTLEVPYYGSLIRRTKTYLCRSCDKKFRSMRQECPKCGARAVRVVRTPPTRRARSATVLAESKPSNWSYQGTFVVETSSNESTA